MSRDSTASNEPDQIILTGDVKVADTDALIVINKSIASPTTSFHLPSVSKREGLELLVFDWSGLAGEMNFITEGDEKVMGIASPWRTASGGVAGSGASLLLIPSVKLRGWLVR